MYTVEISPSAWNQLAHLSLETYRRIREELDAVASALAEECKEVLPGRMKGSGHPTSTPSVVVGDAIALYDVDHEHQRVLLLEVARRLPREL
ncbi:type II toxin-antitoxin system RelE family toxin [Archangium lansingense]|uniref:type II toxin-antitoxin system RelE family toxin n=1 Tax=Archangium lansingense TaxID=2995310 RepID=UPI003B813EBB